MADAVDLVSGVGGVLARSGGDMSNPGGPGSANLGALIGSSIDEAQRSDRIASLFQAGIERALLTTGTGAQEVSAISQISELFAGDSSSVFADSAPSLAIDNASPSGTRAGDQMALLEKRLADMYLTMGEVSIAWTVARTLPSTLTRLLTAQ